MRFNSIGGNTAFAAYLGLVLAGVAPSAVAAGSHGHVHDATAAATNKPAQVHADTANQSGAHRNGTPAAAGHGHAEARAADAALATEPENVQAGQPANLVFMLADATGRPLDRLVRSHARTFHVVIVSEDMAVLGHVHPEDFGEAAAGGEARVEFSFPRPGRYIVAVDFVTEAGPYAKHFLVDVGGEAPAAGTGAAAPQTAVVEMEEGDRYVAAVLLDRAEQVGGYAVALSAPDQIAAGKPAKFGFRVTRHGAPTTDLRAYLDAAMHVAVVKDDLSEFLHTHGTAAGEGRTEALGVRGQAGGEHGGHGAGGNGATSGGGEEPALFGPELTATVTFPAPGRYFLFGQAAHGDMLLIARFPVEVQ